jgi:hypothetical protein
VAAVPVYTLLAPDPCQSIRSAGARIVCFLVLPLSQAGLSDHDLCGLPIGEADQDTFQFTSNALSMCISRPRAAHTSVSRFGIEIPGADPDPGSPQTHGLVVADRRR